MRHKYECIECSHIFNGDPIKQDGVSCPLCRSHASVIGPADPALDKKVKPSLFNVTVSVTGTELFTKLLEVLHHAAETTTCEATRAYIIEQVDLIVADHGEASE
jgi:hypothetical protein